MNTKSLIALMLAFFSSPLLAGDLAVQFASPPASARPWVYWFWNNGNVTRAGITADLEAMRRAGIGGVIIMDVVERFAPPPGTADFMNAEWRGPVRLSVGEGDPPGVQANNTQRPCRGGGSGPPVNAARSHAMLVTHET